MSVESKCAHAASIARSVSRWLRLEGFPMCEQKTALTWTEGFRVHRVGLSWSVAVTYCMPHYIHDNEKARVMEQKAREVLKQKGYTFDERGWIDTRIPKVPS